MARVFTDGAEMGDLLFLTTYSGADVSITATARSGSYAYQMSKNIDNRFMSKSLPSALSEFYYRQAFRVSAEQDIFMWYKGTTLLGYINAAPGGYLRAYVSTSLVATGTTLLAASTWYLVEVHVKIDDSTGDITVKLDGLVELTFSGDTKPGADADIDKLYYTTIAQGTLIIDDLALNDTTGGVDDSWCGDGRVILIQPNAAGDVTMLTPSTGSNYQCVDEIPANGDTDYVESDTPADYDLYNLEACGLSDVTIKRIWAEARARDTVAVGGEVALVIKTGGTEFDGPNVALLTTYSKQVLGTVHRVNPDTTVAWTVSDIDALQAGPKVIS
jgi:hypothetical protein